MKSNEKNLQNLILEYLSLKKVFAYRQNSGAFINSKGRFYRMAVAGAPDIVVVYFGRYIAIEVKDVKGKQNPNQIRFQEALEKVGGLYILARSLDDVMEYIQ